MVSFGVIIVEMYGILCKVIAVNENFQLNVMGRSLNRGVGRRNQVKLSGSSMWVLGRLLLNVQTNVSWKRAMHKLEVMSEEEGKRVDEDVMKAFKAYVRV